MIVPSSPSIRNFRITYSNVTGAHESLSNFEELMFKSLQKQEDQNNAISFIVSYLMVFVWLVFCAVAAYYLRRKCFEFDDLLLKRIAKLDEIAKNENRLTGKAGTTEEEIAILITEHQLPNVNETGAILNGDPVS